MKKITLAVGLFLLLFLPLIGQANNSNHAYRWFVYLHFGEHYYQQKVVEVYAHVGILSSMGGTSVPQPDRKFFWRDVRHLKMSPRDGHFFYKLELAGKSSTVLDGPNDTGPVVQYWLRLADGTDVQTDNFLVPQPEAGIGLSGRDCADLLESPQYHEQKRKFEAQQDADRTYMDAIFVGQ
jgi:hypothetical protein